MWSRAVVLLALAGCRLADGGEALDAAPNDAVAIDAAPPRALTAPARVAITCPGAIPVEGKLDCTIAIAWPEGDVVYQGPAGVGLHGRSSLGFPKKQYAIELRNADGSDKKVALFGMAADADWLLNGGWLDRALVRNKLGYDLHRAMGGAAPDSRFAELTLDGASLGVYLLAERLEHGRGRVAIPDDDGTGRRFMVKGSQDGLASTVQAKSWEVLYPSTVPPPAGVQARMTAVERAITARTDAMFDELDLASLVDFVLLEETVKNNDAYFLSHHLYTGVDGKLRFAPWDLDLSWGQPSYNNNERADAWILYRPVLVSAPAGRPMFREALMTRWRTLRASVLATDAVIARIEDYRALLGGAIARNWSVWDITQPQRTPGFPLYSVISSDDEYAHLEDFVRARLAWIDANLAAY